MPIVIALPLGLWLASILLPSVSVVISPYVELLTQNLTLYAVLGLVAVLAALMRQWSWWYWLALTGSTWLGIETLQQGQLEQALLPGIVLVFSRLLATALRPPLWTLRGFLWMAVLVSWPWWLSKLPLTTYLPNMLLGVQQNTASMTLWHSSALMLLIVVSLALSWLWQRVRRPSQPRQWAEWLVAMQLVLLVLSVHSPDLMRLAVLSVALIVVLGLSMQMLNLAYIDELTQIPGRRALYADLAKLGRRSAVAMLDVDHFKKFNDTYGHDVGDQTLRLIASQLKRSKGFRCYRYGGEEFTLLFNHQNQQKIGEDLEAARRAIADYPVKIRRAKRPRSDKKGRQQRGQQAAKSVRVTVSLGCAVRQPKETDQQLMKRADQLLYRAKKGGRNRVVLQ